MKPSSAFFALRLIAIAVDGGAVDAALVQSQRQTFGAVFGAREHEHPVGAVVVEKSDEQLELLAAVNRHDLLINGFDGRGAATDLYEHRVE